MWHQLVEVSSEFRGKHLLVKVDLSKHCRVGFEGSPTRLSDGDDEVDAQGRRRLLSSVPESKDLRWREGGPLPVSPPPTVVRE